MQLNECFFHVAKDRLPVIPNFKVNDSKKRAPQMRRSQKILLYLDYAFLAKAGFAVGFTSALLMISASPNGLSFAKSTSIGAATKIEE